MPATPPDSEWLEQARQYWRSRNSAMTAVRRLICATIVQTKDAFDAETLHAKCREQDGLISLSTVYRTLRHLVEAELLSEIEGIGDKTYYQVKVGPDIGQSTAYCTDCDEVFPIENPCLTLRESETARRMGFTPKRISLRVDTSCDELEETGSCSRRKEKDQQAD